MIRKLLSIILLPTSLFAQELWSCGGRYTDAPVANEQRRCEPTELKNGSLIRVPPLPERSYVAAEVEKPLCRKPHVSVESLPVRLKGRDVGCRLRGKVVGEWLEGARVRVRRGELTVDEAPIPAQLRPGSQPWQMVVKGPCRSPVGEFVGTPSCASLSRTTGLGRLKGGGGREVFQTNRRGKTRAAR